jgi:hypothetical protein
MLLAAGNLVWLTRIGVHAGYASAVLGPLMMAGLGFGFPLAPSMNIGTFGVAPQDAGVASATLNTGQQIGRGDRHFAAQYYFRRHGGALPVQPPEPGHPGTRAPGAVPDRDVADPRLHHRVLRRGGHRRRRGDLR